MSYLKHLTLGTALALGALSAQAQIAYDNLSTPLGSYIGGFGPYGEIADDVQLATTGLFSFARVAYGAVGFDGDETLTLTLYAMDGGATPGSFGFSTPGTVLFSQTVSIDSSGFATFTDPTPSVALPSTLGIGLIFGGVDFDVQTSDAGPALYDPPTAGSSFYDYWLKGFAGDPDWALYDFSNQPPANFGVQIGVVPEPTTWVAMIGMGGVLGLSLWRRARR